MNKDIFNSFMKNLDWDKIDMKLMLRQDPQTRAARKKFYNSCDDSGGGALDVAELKAGLLRLLRHDDGTSMVPMGDELLPAVRCAFNAARNLEHSSKTYKVQKGKKAKVGQREFHAFLFAFKNYLQLLEMFEFLDGQADDNQKLSLRECKRGVFLLAGWGITEEELEEKFKGVEAWESYMTFKDFAQWCIDESGSLAKLDLDDSDKEDVMIGKARHGMQKEHGIEMKRAGHGLVARDSDENHETVMELFAKWDSDGSGEISEEEMKMVLMSLDKTLSEDQVTALFLSADHNKDGKLSVNEFLQWLLS